MDCKSCRYALWSKGGVFLGCSSTCVSEKLDDYAKQMKKLLNGAVMSKFVSKDACVSFRDAVSQCIKILENEQIGGDYE